MPHKHIEQYKHNCTFHVELCNKFPDQYYDWKITALFYAALHCIKAYYTNKGIDIGSTHSTVEKSINPNIANAPYPVNKGCWSDYKSLYRYSHTSRYDGIADPITFQASLKVDHDNCLVHLKGVVDYVKKHGLNI